MLLARLESALAGKALDGEFAALRAHEAQRQRNFLRLISRKAAVIISAEADLETK